MIEKSEPRDLLGDITQYWSLPAIKYTYEAAGTLIERTAGLFSLTLQNWVADKWYDPLPTRAILALSRSFEWISGFNAERSPSKWRLFHFLDQSIISISQQLHSYTTRVNQLLELPEKIQNFIYKFSFDSVVMHLSNVGPKEFSWVNRCVVLLKRAALMIIDLAIRIADTVIGNFYYFFTNKEIYVFGFFKEIITDARNNLHSRITGHVIDSVRKKESKLRAQIVGKAVEKSLEFLVDRTTRIGLTVLSGGAIYFITHNILEHKFGIPASTIHLVAGAILLQQLCVASIPTLDYYYKKFNPSYHPKSLSLLEFCQHFYIQKFYPILKVTSTFLRNRSN